MAKGGDVARTTGKVSLVEMIREGKLKRNEKLVINRRSNSSIEGTLRADGSIVVNGEAFKSPSTAACSALDVSSVDGWLRWRVVRLDGKSLAEVRGDQ
jgi:hypothetical protein